MPPSIDSPLSRAEQAREALKTWFGHHPDADALIPEGAIILTREEAERIRDAMRWCPQHDEDFDDGALALLSAPDPSNREVPPKD